jgi:hypothetical protein
VCAVTDSPTRYKTLLTYATELYDTVRPALSVKSEVCSSSARVVIVMRKCLTSVLNFHTLSTKASTTLTQTLHWKQKIDPHKEAYYVLNFLLFLCLFWDLIVISQITWPTKTKTDKGNIIRIQKDFVIESFLFGSHTLLEAAQRTIKKLSTKWLLDLLRSTVPLFDVTSQCHIAYWHFIFPTNMASETKDVRSIKICYKIST